MWACSALQLANVQLLEALVQRALHILVTHSNLDAPAGRKLPIESPGQKLSRQGHLSAQDVTALLYALGRLSEQGSQEAAISALAARLAAAAEQLLLAFAPLLSLSVTVR